MRQRRSLATLAALLMVVGAGGCLDDEESSSGEGASYSIYYDVDVTEYEGATVVAHVEYRTPNGGTLAFDPAAYPWQAGAAGYESGDTLRLRVYGTATATTARSGVTRRLGVWGYSPAEVPVDFGVDTFDGPAGDFDDVKLVILP